MEHAESKKRKGEAKRKRLSTDGLAHIVEERLGTRNIVFLFDPFGYRLDHAIEDVEEFLQSRGFKVTRDGCENSWMPRRLLFYREEAKKKECHFAPLRIAALPTDKPCIVVTILSPMMTSEDLKSSLALTKGPNVSEEDCVTLCFEL